MLRLSTVVDHIPLDGSRVTFYSYSTNINSKKKKTKEVVVVEEEEEHEEEELE